MYKRQTLRKHSPASSNASKHPRQSYMKHALFQCSREHVMYLKCNEVGLMYVVTISYCMYDTYSMTISVY